MAFERTNWGYQVDGPIPDLLSVEQFDRLGGAALSAGREAKEAAIAAASAVVRAWCGWHVSPVMPCRWTGPGRGEVIELPCMAIESVGRVEDAAPDAHVPSHGVLRRVAADAVTVEFRAGYPSSDGVGQVVAQLVANSLAASAGVREEHAGQVGASYNQTDYGVSGGVRLLKSDKDALAPYRITGVR
ncbi:hypothetical protein HLV35_07510 [Eggerthellaceae bacterium zg-997]|nr:hypothetical protein [Eggerthellaceae bacterium zg-997]